MTQIEKHSKETERDGGGGEKSGEVLKRKGLMLKRRAYSDFLEQLQLETKGLIFQASLNKTSQLLAPL